MRAFNLELNSLYEVRRSHVFSYLGFHSLLKGVTKYTILTTLVY